MASLRQRSRLTRAVAHGAAVGTLAGVIADRLCTACRIGNPHFWSATAALAGLLAAMALGSVAINRVALRRRPAVSSDRPVAGVEEAILAGMSHELRTPLNAVIGFAELMEAETFGPLGHPYYIDYARYIGVAGARLLALVTDILDFAQIGAGRLDLYPVRIASERVIAECARRAAHNARMAGVDITVQPGGGPMIFADPGWLRRALDHLISNAIKFTAPGGRVHLVARPCPEGTEIIIADTGVGMTADELVIALKPLHQVDVTLARRHEGAGLGLSLAKRLIEVQGGRFGIDSTPGQGTTISLILPTYPDGLAS